MSQLSETAFPERLESVDSDLEELSFRTQAKYLEKLGIRSIDDSRFKHFINSGTEESVGYGGQVVPSFDHWAAATANPVPKFLPTNACFGLILYSAFLTPLEISRIRQISPPSTWPSYVPRPLTMGTGKVVSSLLAHEGSYYLVRAFPYQIMSRSLPITAVAAAYGIPQVYDIQYSFMPLHPIARSAVIFTVSFSILSILLSMAEHAYVRIAHPAGHRLYGTLYDSLQRIVGQEGMRSVFMRALPFLVLREVTYWTTLQALTGRFGHWAVKRLDDGTPDPLGRRAARVFALAGAAGGAVAAAVTNFLDVMVVRMFLSASRPPMTTWQVWRHLIRTDGIAGTLRGVGPRMLWGLGVGSVFGSRLASWGVTASERHMIDTELSADPRVRKLRESWYLESQSLRERADARLQVLGASPPYAERGS